MEAFGIIGMSFGMMGMTFGLLAWIQIQGVSKELADMKTSLRNTGVLDGESLDEKER